MNERDGQHPGSMRVSARRLGSGELAMVFTVEHLRRLLAHALVQEDRKVILVLPLSAGTAPEERQ